MRRPLFALAALATLLGLAWAIENWRGARAWNVAKRDLIARGEPLAMERLLPPRPPDEQNFAMTPLLRPLLDYTRSSNRLAGSVWRNPGAFSSLTAIRLPEVRRPELETSSIAKRNVRRPEHEATDGRFDLFAQAFGIRMAVPKPADPRISPELIIRYGLLPPGRKAQQPTNETEIAAAITDPAAEVLKFLDRFKPEMDEIATALRRPHCHFPVHWEDNFSTLLPHLAPLKSFSTMFSVRAAARLAKRDSAGGFEDAMTCLQLANASEKDPLFISQLVGLSQERIAQHAVWEGLVEHRWNEAQLAEFQREFARSDARERFLFAIRGERVLANNTFDGWASFPGREIDLPMLEETQPYWGLRWLKWIPGWIRQNQVRHNRFYDLLIEQTKQTNWPANLARHANQGATLQEARLAEISPYNAITRALVLGLAEAKANQQFKAARAQVTEHLAEVACALERFRIAHGTYPKELSELMPNYLTAVPRDPMSEGQLRYERIDEKESLEFGWFNLWSVGPDGKDDAGTMSAPMSAQNIDQQGDWVWPLPVKRVGRRLF
ncbi:MAG: hypothetical protein EXS31_06495 [Pedosphaera sp.]|nr:hypothetical protein [Pedosphaera sp.]